MLKNLFVFPVLLLVLGATVISFSWSTTPISTFEKSEDPLKLAAFQVLEAKCNACHHVQKPFYVFSLENMDRFANDIHSQVFIKKKMPKGDTYKLTTEEAETLKKWLDNSLEKKK